MTNHTRIDLNGSIDITRIESLRAMLADGLQQALPIQLDAKEAERFDAAALQLLCAFMQETKTLGLECHWAAVSPALIDAARLTGLTNILSLPEVA